jgi:hypothetical protein
VDECKKFGEIRSWPLLSLLVSYGWWIIAGILLASNGGCDLLDGDTRLREGVLQHRYLHSLQCYNAYNAAHSI